MKHLIPLALFTLPMFAYAAPTGINNLQGATYQCQMKGNQNVNFLLSLQMKLPLDNFQVAEYSAEFHGNGSPAKTSVTATTISTRVTAGIHLQANIYGYAVSIDQIEYSALPEVMPLGISATMTDISVSRNAGKETHFNCSVN